VAIQGESLRVTGQNKDDLQEVIQLPARRGPGRLPLQFENYSLKPAPLEAVCFRFRLAVLGSTGAAPSPDLGRSRPQAASCGGASALEQPGAAGRSRPWPPCARVGVGRMAFAAAARGWRRCGLGTTVATKRLLEGRAPDAACAESRAESAPMRLLDRAISTADLVCPGIDVPAPCIGQCWRWRRRLASRWPGTAPPCGRCRGWRRAISQARTAGIQQLAPLRLLHQLPPIPARSGSWRLAAALRLPPGGGSPPGGLRPASRAQTSCRRGLRRPVAGACLSGAAATRSWGPHCALRVMQSERG